MRPEYKIGDEVYVGRELLHDSKIYVIYNIDEETDTHTIIERGGVWDFKLGQFQLPDGDIVQMRHLKYGDLMSVETGLEFLIDRFSFLINRHVSKTTRYDLWKPEKDEIIQRITKKLYDNR